MIFHPRFHIVGFYAASWLFVVVLYIAGAPAFFLALAVLIQLINTASMTCVPVRVSFDAGEIECYFPLRSATMRFIIAETEWSAHHNPIQMASHSDTIVLRSRNSKAVIWRMGVKDFDRICDELRTAKA